MPDIERTTRMPEEKARWRAINAEIVECRHRERALFNERDALWALWMERERSISGVTVPMTTLTHCSRCGRPIRAVTRDGEGLTRYVNHGRRCLSRGLAPDVPVTRAPVQRAGDSA